ncbi:hypothetical protein C8J56DRAFT_1046925 [Mycena floridula]|nr:hypothetical protein C8J56DRAFT_1046925 [Mycena floridula]
MRQALETLERQRPLIAETIPKLKTILSPVRALPTDVLCEIFAACIDEDMTPNANPGPSATMASCSPFFPPLWSYIGIYLKNANIHDRLAKIISCHLRRSGQHLLSISLLCADPLPPHSAVIDLLFAQSSRWTALHFYSWSSDQSVQIFDEVAGFIPSLQCLALVCGPDSHSTAFLDAPSLTTVIAAPHSLRNTPPSQITEFSSYITHPILPTIQQLSVLGNFRGIRNCTLALWYSEGLLSFTIEMPQLTNLSLIAKQKRDLKDVLGQFLGCLAAPALTWLNMEGRNLDIDSLIVCKERSQFVLTDLRLDSAVLTANTGFRLLEKLPTIKATVSGLPRSMYRVVFPTIATSLCPASAGNFGG